MKDSSRILSHFISDSSYFNFDISKRKICLRVDPTSPKEVACLKYRYNGHYLITSKATGYRIDRASKDTLILSEYIVNLDPTKLKRYYFVRAQTIFDANKRNPSKTHIANKYYTPKLKISLEEKLNLAFKNDHTNFLLKGTISLDIKEKKVQTEIIESTSTDSLRLKKISQIISESYKLWELKKFKHLNKLQIPFVLKDLQRIQLKTFDINYFTHSYETFNTLSGDTHFLINLSDYYFSEGVRSFDLKGYFYAIVNFSEAYRLNPMKIDALYNRAATYFQIGDMPLACADWQELMLLGQTKGKHLYQKNNCGGIKKKKLTPKKNENDQRFSYLQNRFYAKEILEYTSNF
ncbi:tetratricopeptide repeat protein [Flavicella sediminum]|uniref:hypothetical protein n=1 Tax=Flavicella sediminum TaxID=2585141 RepID=UPI00111D28A8|nr:hypothetical protein [Flavicella sediminum]